MTESKDDPRLHESIGFPITITQSIKILRLKPLTLCSIDLHHPSDGLLPSWCTSQQFAPCKSINFIADSGSQLIKQEETAIDNRGTYCLVGPTKVLVGLKNKGLFLNAFVHTGYDGKEYVRLN